MSEWIGALRVLTTASSLGSRHVRTLWALLVICCGCGLVVQSAKAQTVPAAAPLHTSVDRNGVDLTTGFVDVVSPSIMTGQGSMPAFQFVSDGDTNQAALTTYTGSISISGSTVTVSLGGATETFTSQGSGTYSSDQEQGSVLTSDATNYYYTLRDGTKITYSMSLVDSAYGSNEISSISYPDGRSLSFNYITITYTTYLIYPLGEPPTIHTYTIYRLQSVTSNTGYQLQFFYLLDPTQNGQAYTLTDSQQFQSPSSDNVGATYTITKVTMFNLGVDYCGAYAFASSCSFTPGWPSLAIATNTISCGTSSCSATGSIPATQTFTDTMSRATTFTFGGASDRIASVATPAGTTTYGYDTDGSGRVASVNNGVNSWSYAYSGSSYLQTSVTDQLNETSTVVSNGGLISSYTDGLNRKTTYGYDGHGHLNLIGSPGGGITQYSYDARGNITQTTQVSSTPGSPANIVTSANFDANCTIPIKCNRPNSTTDANNQTTNYNYCTSQSSCPGLPLGVLLSIDAPAPTSGATAPETRFSYTASNAWYKQDTSGSMTEGSAVYLLTGTSACQTQAPATCVGTADEATTTIAYQAGSSSAASNLLPISVTQGSGNNSLALTTSMTYDNIGNVVSVTGPRTDVSQVTNYVWDADRELTMTIDPATGGSTRSATSLTYDAGGRIEYVDKGTTTQPNGSDFQALERTQYGYDGASRLSTAQVLNGTSTPALSLTQYNYDLAGRPNCTAIRMNSNVYTSLPDACSQSTQGSYGPDLIRQLGYDAANEVQTETDGVGTSLAEISATLAYTQDGLVSSATDARGYAVGFSYDGLDRLSSKSYADGGEEQYAYDPNGNLLTYTNRGGYQLQFGYDALNRMTSEQGITNGTLNTNLRWWDTALRTFSYDLLNRMASAVNNQGTYSWGYDAASRLTGYYDSNLGSAVLNRDGAGNLTYLTQPDGFQTAYAYDAMNRMTGASFLPIGGAWTTAAYLYYDSIGRQSGMYYGDGSTQAIYYDYADRVTAVVHAFPNSSSYNVNLSDVYDPANRRLYHYRDNTLYSYNPPSNSTSYGTANNLNHYPSVGGINYSYWAEGPEGSDGTNAYDYDEANQLIAAGPASGGAPWEGFYRNPLGQLAWRVQNDSNGSATAIRPGLEGDRAEAASEILYQQAAGGSFTPAGTMHYVLGPNPDQRLAFVDTTNAVYYPHTDEQGSTIALSASGSGASSFHYDPFGVSADPLPTLGSGPSAYPYRYTGQRLDLWLGQYDYKARVYNPQTGRFLQPDPAGLSTGMNLYSYADNDPVNETDPTGTVGLETYLMDGPAAVAELSQLADAIAGSTTVPPVIITGTLPGTGGLFSVSQSFQNVSPAQNGDDRGRSQARSSPQATQVAGVTVTAQRKYAQEGPLPPDIEDLFPPEPTIPEPSVPYPRTPGTQPGPGWKQIGPRGNWYNPKTKETLSPDLGHPEPIGPHWDWKAPDGNWYRWFPDGTVVPKSFVFTL